MELLNKGLLIYYFNIIMISAIIFLVLLVAYNRTKKVVVNVGERQTPMGKESKGFYKNMFIVVYFGLLFFTIREFGSEIMDFISNGFSYVSGLING